VVDVDVGFAAAVDDVDNGFAATVDDASDGLAAAVEVVDDDFAATVEGVDDDFAPILLVVVVDSFAARGGVALRPSTESVEFFIISFLC
jgi:hypothetical protein